MVESAWAGPEARSGESFSGTRFMVRAARSALDPRRWLVGGLAVLAIAAGNLLFDHWPGADTASEAAVSASPGWPWNWELGYAPSGAPRQDALREIVGHLDQPGADLLPVVWNPRLVARPLLDVLEPAVAVIVPKTTWNETARTWSRFLWAVLVWSLAGVILVRLAAVDLARGESVSLGRALKFGLSRLGSLLGAPLIVCAFLGALWAVGSLGGLVGRIPAAGPVLVGLLWIVPLLLGLLMSLVVAGFVVGWPLMVATIGVEDSDAYDGFNHSFSYLSDRPASLVGHSLLGVLVGSVSVFLAWVVVTLAVSLGALSVAGGLGAGLEPNDSLVAISNSSERGVLADREVPGQLVGDGAAGGVPLATGLLVFWLRGVIVLLVGYAAGYFWTAVTALYLLLRRSADGIDVADIWIDEEDDEPATAEADTEAETGAEITDTVAQTGSEETADE